MSQQTSALMTVRDLVEVLSGFDQDLPVVVSTHYGNDIGLASRIGIHVATIEHDEGDFWTQAPDDLEPEEEFFDAVRAVVVTARGDAR